MGVEIVDPILYLVEVDDGTKVDFSILVEADLIEPQLAASLEERNCLGGDSPNPKVVDVPGFEPGSPKATALQAAELAILFNTSEVVAIVGFEPTISGI